MVEELFVFLLKSYSGKTFSFAPQHLCSESPPALSAPNAPLITYRDRYNDSILGKISIGVPRAIAHPDRIQQMLKIGLPNLSSLDPLLLGQ